MLRGDEIVGQACADALEADGHVVEMVDDASAVQARAAEADVLVVVPPIPVVGRSGGGATLSWLETVHAAVAAVSPPMQARGDGRIVLVVVASGLPGRSATDQTSSAMWGAVGLARTAARELAPHGVTVNAVRIGLVDHPALRDEAAADPAVAEALAAVERQAPLRRTVAPSDVAAAVAFLASPAAAYVTGVVLPVDAGLTIGLGG